MRRRCPFCVFVSIHCEKSWNRWDVRCHVFLVQSQEGTSVDAIRLDNLGDGLVGLQNRLQVRRKLRGRPELRVRRGLVSFGGADRRKGAAAQARGKRLRSAPRLERLLRGSLSDGVTDKGGGYRQRLWGPQAEMSFVVQAFGVLVLLATRVASVRWAGGQRNVVVPAGGCVVPGGVRAAEDASGGGPDSVWMRIWFHYGILLEDRKVGRCWRGRHGRARSSHRRTN
jgi:hypothetical protein